MSGTEEAAAIASGTFTCASCGGAWEKIAGALELDVRSLAAVWEDHADYREAWRL